MSVAVPEISVVVPTHRRRELVRRGVAALRNQTLDGASYEIVVVCDGCDDGTGEALRSEATAPGGPVLRVVEQDRSGAATARNRGAAVAAGRLLVFLDDDMIARPGCLEAHRAAHAGRVGTLLLGAIPVHPDSPRSFLSAGLAGWATRRDARLRAAADVPWGDALTGHLSLTREVFDRVGRFDVAFTAGGAFGGEDIEFGWRAKATGVPIVYEPRAVAEQVFQKKFAALCRNIRDAAAADTVLARKHPAAAEGLTLGGIDDLPRRERQALRFTLRAPRLSAVVFAPARAALAAAARAGFTGLRWEHLHAIVRAHLYGAGLVDAGWTDRSRTA